MAAARDVRAIALGSIAYVAGEAWASTIAARVIEERWSSQFS